MGSLVCFFKAILNLDMFKVKFGLKCNCSDDVVNKLSS